jgi:hypothetical protein
MADEDDKQLEKLRKRQERYWNSEFMPHKCPDCGSTFSSEANFKRHLKNNKWCKEFRERKRSLMEALTKVVGSEERAKAMVERIL